VRIRSDADEPLAQLAGAFADALLPTVSHPAGEHAGGLAVTAGAPIGAVGGLEESIGIAFNREN